jgi:hypothetical protein
MSALSSAPPQGGSSKAQSPVLHGDRVHGVGVGRATAAGSSVGRRTAAERREGAADRFACCDHRTALRFNNAHEILPGHRQRSARTNRRASNQLAWRWPENSDEAERHRHPEKGLAPPIPWRCESPSPLISLQARSARVGNCTLVGAGRQVFSADDRESVNMIRLDGPWLGACADHRAWTANHPRRMVRRAMDKVIL